MKTAVAAAVFAIDRIRTVLLAISFIIFIKCGLVLASLFLPR
jgi:hypothetical protein